MSNNSDILQRGDRIGCYRIEEVLGRGGFAVTYLATDENLDVEVAIKEYLPREITQRDDNLHVSARKPEFAEDYDTGLDNFAREAKTLARFKHPHIVRVHQVLHANNTAYMVMDFEHGQELGEILEQQQTLSEDELRGILFPILDGVEEIHRHGFVHRDIKPSNIYVRHNGSPVLIDFGAARYTMSETTQQLTAVVTVGYTPIEQYNVSEDAQGPWSDIYALAAVCYEAVTGDVPTDSVTRASASVTKGDDPLPSVRTQIKRDYSDDCLDAIDWGLRMDAEDRPQVTAQWRDSFDGVFNPASAYMSQKEDVSIYSAAHRIKKPSQSNDRPPAIQSASSRDDVVSIPLRSTETSRDTGVVSLEKESMVTTMPPIPRSTSGIATSSRGDASSRIHGERNVTEHPSARLSANDSTPRDALHQDTEHNRGPESQRPQESQQQKPKRSKFERPSHLEQAPPKKRALRDEIEFDDSDWDYVPQKSNSPLKLLFPVIGLAAVVIGSLTLVNFPQLIPGFGNDDSDLTSEQALAIAELKINNQSYIFPKGDSALDYYQLALKDDPANTEAKAGIASIETNIREQIADNMERNNLSEANRILARADDAGLNGLYNSPASESTTPESSTTIETTVAETSPIVPPKQRTIINSIDTAPIEPTSTNAESRVEPAEVLATVSPRPPANGIDNTVSPFIEGQIAKIDSLIDQQRFTEARALLRDTDKFIPNATTSTELLRRITSGESAAANAAQATAQQAEVANTTPAQPVESTESALSEPSTSQPVPVEVSPVASEEPARNSYIDANGPAADHLDKLRLALEAKDIDAVQALSQSLPEGRVRFLNSTFARHHRLDVIIDNVTTSGDTISGRLNVAMFGKADDGSIYGAGKWNGAIIEATRSNGVWQKIRW